ncbi:MAG TPA: amidohydrolase family protein [Pyrinomonadaceae bacterium]|jgi:imidazolonepropionase-like amidohydrolase|nr:amidohydrolase family protein [Pyrinomonadaceae bacterium]
MKTITALLLLLSIGVNASAQTPASDHQQFVRVEAPLVALAHVRVIDGTGAAARDDQTIVISNGKIQSVGPSANANLPRNILTLDLQGYTVLPGLVGMHNHLFFPQGGTPAIYSDMGNSFPRLYLALGVTTIRTTGSVAPFTDLEIKRLIDTGRMIGPKMHITAPYLEGRGAFTPVMHELTGPEDARRMVNFWAEEGATSFKAYMNITRAELSAAVEEAHKRGLKVTGHLCSIGFREAAEIGIDNLEHGLLVDSEFVPDKKPDVCPPGSAVSASLRQLDLNSAAAQETIRTLVAKNVALTSTLPVFEAAGAPLTQSGIGAASALLNPRVLSVMSTDARVRYLTARARVSSESDYITLLRKAMEFERRFVRAGGLLIAGLDPTGNGGVVAGFGDLREVELLVEAGFTPLEAIKIASFNGAKFLGEDARIGSIAAGKQADLMVVKGNPAANISDIERVEIVFKDGIGYDSEKLIQSVQGLVGIR